MILPKSRAKRLENGILAFWSLHNCFLYKLTFHIWQKTDEEKSLGAILSPNSRVIPNASLSNPTCKWSSTPVTLAPSVWLKSALPLQFFCDCSSSGPHFLSPGPEQLIPTCLPYCIFLVHPQHCSQRNLFDNSWKCNYFKIHLKVFKTVSLSQNKI